MKDCKIILITSCKGGVGKSTVTANLGYYLAASGHRTLLIDCDFGNRCLDLILGCEDEMLYDICDVCAGRIDMADAAVTDRRSSNLLAVAAPYVDTDGCGAEIPDKALFCSKLRAAGESMQLDYILIDTPGALGAPLELAAAAADMGIIVSTHHPTAIRAADNTASALCALGVSDCRMIINCFDSDAVLCGDRAGPVEMIDRALLPLIGVIPYDAAFALGGEKGRLACELRCKNVRASLSNIACRIDGKNIPLFIGWKKIRRKKLLK